ncbi:uncharacterized protein [Bemisia tabaci]|uniref:uncharacterized protein n=1 Tax=Bemisia tabaci TaxID=7038 RepID=UPI003B28A603
MVLFGEVVNDPLMDAKYIDHILHSTQEGLAVLNYYHHNKTLNNHMRLKLSSVIINYELQSDFNKRLTSRQFINMAKAIVALFPGEQEEVYYTPYKKDVHGNKCLAKGKLWDKYFNSRRKLKSYGLIERGQRRRPVRKTTDPPSNSTALVPSISSASTLQPVDTLAAFKENHNHSATNPNSSFLQQSCCYWFCSDWTDVSITERHVRNFVGVRGFPTELELEATSPGSPSSEAAHQEQGLTLPDEVLDVVESQAVRSRLQAAVRDSTDGKAVLLYYNTHACLNNKMRQRLAKVIIDNEIKDDPSRVISHRAFQALAHAVADLFPPEKSESYFTPYCRNRSGKTFNAKGKLIDRYKNMRKSLRACGLIKSKHPMPPRQAPKEDISLFSGTGAEHVRWLTKFVEPWDVVEDYWRITSGQRLEYLDKDPNLTADGYLDLFPALKEPEGHKLIDIDFATKYPEARNALFDNWDNFTDKILNFAQNKFNSDLKFQLIITDAALDVFVEDATARRVTAFHLLSFLMTKYQTCRTSSGAPWRPSREEVKNGLLLLAPSREEMHDALEKRRLAYQDVNLPLTPIPIIVGALGDPTASCLVHYKGVEYQLPSPLAAIDLCFKMFHVLRLDFSPETLYAWLFVSKYVYQIREASSTNYIPVTTLATDLRV